MTNSANNSDVLKWYFENEKNLTILAKGKKIPLLKIGLINFCHTLASQNIFRMATISGLCYPIWI